MSICPKYSGNLGAFLKKKKTAHRYSIFLDLIISFSSHVTLVVNGSRARLNVSEKASLSMSYREFKLFPLENFFFWMKKAERKAKCFIFLAISHRDTMNF